MEASERGREAAVHRRGQTTARATHEGAPRLQVQAAEKAQITVEKGQVRLSDPDDSGNEHERVDQHGQQFRLPGRPAGPRDGIRGQGAQLLPTHLHPRTVPAPGIQCGQDGLCGPQYEGARTGYELSVLPLFQPSQRWSESPPCSSHPPGPPWTVPGAMLPSHLHALTGRS